jgi:crotonobetainyl-CoA:carnitine CoA-transferase CaiB-like acyl-CoA transferase
MDQPGHADGYLNLVAIRDAMFFGVCHAIGRKDWIDDARLATNDGRKQHAEEINQVIAAALKEEGSAYWQDIFEKNDVLCSPVLDCQAFRQDPQVKHAEIGAK